MRLLVPGALVGAVLVKHAPRLFLGELVTRGKSAEFVSGKFVSHATSTMRRRRAFRHTSLRMVAKAPPSISHLAPLT